MNLKQKRIRDQRLAAAAADKASSSGGGSGKPNHGLGAHRPRGPSPFPKYTVTAEQVAALPAGGTNWGAGIYNQISSLGQGGCGDCTGFAVAHQIDLSWLLNYPQVPFSSRDGRMAFYYGALVWTATPDCSQGSFLVDALQAAANIGVCAESFNCSPTSPASAAALADAAHCKVGPYQSTGTDWTAICTALAAKQPISFSFSCYDSFHSGDPTWPPPAGAIVIGGHAMAACDFGPGTGAFANVMGLHGPNNWGDGWSCQGARFPGWYFLPMAFVTSGSFWESHPLLSLILSAAPAPVVMNGSLTLVTAPATLNPGQAFDATFQVANTGGLVMPASGATPVRIGSQNPRDNSIWKSVGAYPWRVSLPNDIPVGGNVAVTGSFFAPAVAGAYQFAWQLVQDGVAWFGNTVAQAITVTGATPPPPPPPPPSGNTQMLIDTIKTEANSLVLGQITQTQIDKLKADVGSLVADAISPSPPPPPPPPTPTPGVYMPPATSLTDGNKDTWGMWPGGGITLNNSHDAADGGYADLMKINTAGSACMRSQNLWYIWTPTNAPQHKWRLVGLIEPT